jgi:hypothetical protein
MKKVIRSSVAAIIAPIAWKLAKPLLLKAAKWLRDKWAAELQEGKQ